MPKADSCLCVQGSLLVGGAWKPYVVLGIELASAVRKDKDKKEMSLLPCPQCYSAQQNRPDASVLRPSGAARGLPGLSPVVLGSKLKALQALCSSPHSRLPSHCKSLLLTQDARDSNTTNRGKG